MKEARQLGCDQIEPISVMRKSTSGGDEGLGLFIGGTQTQIRQEQELFIGGWILEKIGHLLAQPCLIAFDY